MVSFRRHVRHWRTYLTCGGLSLVFALACWNALSEREKVASRHAESEQRPYQLRPNTSANSPLISGKACRGVTDKEVENLCIEERAAEAAESQAVWAGITFCLGVLGTGFIVVTLLYTRQAAVAAQQSANTAIAQVELARQDFLASHRPRFAVREVHWAIVGERHDVIFSIVNIGDSTGTIIEEEMELVIVPDGKFAIPPQPRNIEQEILRHILTPGDRLDVRMGVDTPMHILMIPENDSVKVVASVHLVVVLIYVDTLDHRRRTVAQRKYIRSDGTFLDLGNPNYEYSD